MTKERVKATYEAKQDKRNTKKTDGLQADGHRIILNSLQKLKIDSLYYFMVSETNILTIFRWAICYTSIINCTNFEKMHGFSINMQRKIIFRIKCKLHFSSWPLRISILPRVSCDNVQVIFLFVHVIVTYE